MTLGTFLFTLHPNSVAAFSPVASMTTRRTNTHTNTNTGMMRSTTHKKQKKIMVWKMNASSADDEVAALRAAAQKSRDDADRLAKELGKDVSSDKSTASTSTAIKPQTQTVQEVLTLLNNSNNNNLFRSTDTTTQINTLDTLLSEGKLSLWKAAQRGPANTSFPTPLRPYPVSLSLLSTRSGGKLTPASLGVDGNDPDVSLDDFKDYTIGVTLGSSALAIAALALLPQNIGATLCYLIALIPIAFIGVGSTAPGIIAGLIQSLKGTADTQELQSERVCRHEAGHFLCGYLCGLPISGVSIEDSIPRIEFALPSSTSSPNEFTQDDIAAWSVVALSGSVAEVMGTGVANVSIEDSIPRIEFALPSGTSSSSSNEFTQDDIAAWSVVALSGSVAEVMGTGVAKGGENDLLQLENIFRKSQEFLGAAQQQDLTRWGALVSYYLIQGNQDKYELLVKAFGQNKSVEECIAILEGV
eukprot:CAMPEP_0184871954 /NCGR_PEP_ID=MMETSP0580-20130426/41013_1 /TAXON_ID=1118495 /ORGANISM="Dactyliosolen fragilissimus" /LENGTH=470 /DNA_ID=CAMNT_0027374683 /DNA_START=212 /DNA_END=1624 /DNA_ORIENTATION=+